MSSMMTMRTNLGVEYDHSAPTADMIHIGDIAHALGMLCRFGGHTNRFYSVAEHSVLVSHQVPREYALQGLLHDATEAYVVDVPSPLKRLMPQYQSLEELTWRAIAEKFDLPLELHQSVKEADNTVLLAERDKLFNDPRGKAWAWAKGIVPAKVTINGFAPPTAKIIFLDRFFELCS